MLLLESIKAVDGEVLNLAYHQQRLERSLAELGAARFHDLKALIRPPSSGTYRCRVLYSEERVEVGYHPYAPRPMNSLKLVVDDAIDYHLKYADRSALDRLFELRGSCDDVAIVKNGRLTDTTIANIALFDGELWVTPDVPLLRGTARARLIEEGVLTERPIPVESIASYQKYAVFNALIGFVEVTDGIMT